MKAFLSQYLEDIINENDMYIHCNWIGGSYVFPQGNKRNPNSVSCEVMLQDGGPDSTFMIV